MPGYTQVNLNDVRDLAADSNLAPQHRGSLANADLELEKLGMSYQR